MAFELTIEIMAFFMLFMAISISVAATVHQMIPLYQWQSGALALITLMTAIAFQSPDLVSQFFMILFTIIPISLCIVIEPLLAQATVPEDLSAIERIKRLLNPQVRHFAQSHALPVWLARRLASRSAIGQAILDLLLMTLAFVTAFNLVPHDRFLANILAISFSLLLIGLSIMLVKQDIISQIMGLLVMEHGMFLAAIRVITSPLAVVAFVTSLLLYIMITLTILVFLLPDLHRISGTIDIDHQDHLKG